jgi:hypothetical protein
MQINVGPFDRVIRLLVGLVVLSFVLTGESAARWLGLIGLVPLATALAGSCPVYALFGAATCPIRRKGE